MTGNPDASGGGREPADSGSTAASVGTERPRTGRATELALVAAGLGVVVYLLGFVDDVGSRSLIVPLLLGGGLLAGSVALPTVSARVLAPSAVTAVTGALLMLQAVVGGTNSAVAVGALVLALLEAAAAAGAVLLHAGLVQGRPRPRKPATPPYAGYPAQGYPAQGQPPQGYPPQGYPAFPGQQYPGQPYPGSYAGLPGEPYQGDRYAGEHAYAQQARYGTQYGVPGYPPPPPYGTPGYDPSTPGAAERADATAPTPPRPRPPRPRRYRSGAPATGAPAAGGTSTPRRTPPGVRVRRLPARRSAHRSSDDRDRRPCDGAGGLVGRLVDRQPCGPGGRGEPGGRRERPNPGHPAHHRRALIAPASSRAP